MATLIFTGVVILVRSVLNSVNESFTEFKSDLTNTVRQEFDSLQAKITHLADVCFIWLMETTVNVVHLPPDHLMSRPIPHQPALAIYRQI